MGVVMSVLRCMSSPCFWFGVTPPRPLEDGEVIKVNSMPRMSASLRLSQDTDSHATWDALYAIAKKEENMRKAWSVASSPFITALSPPRHPQTPESDSHTPYTFAQPHAPTPAEFGHGKRTIPDDTGAPKTDTPIKRMRMQASPPSSVDDEPEPLTMHEEVAAVCYKRAVEDAQDHLADFPFEAVAKCDRVHAGRNLSTGGGSTSSALLANAAPLDDEYPKAMQLCDPVIGASRVWIVDIEANRVSICMALIPDSYLGVHDLARRFMVTPHTNIDVSYTEACRHVQGFMLECTQYVWLFEAYDEPTNATEMAPTLTKAVHDGLTALTNKWPANRVMLRPVDTSPPCKRIEFAVRHFFRSDQRNYAYVSVEAPNSEADGRRADLHRAQHYEVLQQTVLKYAGKPGQFYDDQKRITQACMDAITCEFDTISPEVQLIFKIHKANLRKLDVAIAECKQPIMFVCEYRRLQLCADALRLHIAHQTELHQALMAKQNGYESDQNHFTDMDMCGYWREEHCCKRQSGFPEHKCQYADDSASDTGF